MMFDYIEGFKKKFKFQRPIVGIQVRRTDKLGTEASLHKLSEYMQKVEYYFDQLDYENLKNKKVSISRTNEFHWVYGSTFVCFRMNELKDAYFWQQMKVQSGPTRFWIGPKRDTFLSETQK